MKVLWNRGSRKFIVVVEGIRLIHVGDEVSELGFRVNKIQASLCDQDLIFAGLQRMDDGSGNFRCLIKIGGLIVHTFPASKQDASEIYAFRRMTGLTGSRRRH